MGDRNWSMMGDLLLENWNNRSVGSKYIAKSYGNKLGLNVLEHPPSAILICILFAKMSKELLLLMMYMYKLEQ